MKRIITVVFLLFFLVGCAASGSYDDGYADGYAAGYAAAQDHLSRSMPEFTPAPSVRPASSPRPTTQLPSDDITVYVSRSFKIHKKSNCSGMTVYTEMTLSQAESFGYEKCKKCWK